MTVAEMKKQVCKYAKLCYEQKLFAGTSGNLSVFNGEVMAITPTSVPYEAIVPEDMVVMKTDGTVLEGHYRPSSEWRMHAEVYRAMPDVRAEVHTHSPYASAFAVNHLAVPDILIQMKPILGGDIPLAQFAPQGTREVGLEAVKVLKGRSACLLANHGVLAVGETLEEAQLRAVYVEDAARICSIAMHQGKVYGLR